jgi:FAD/FMN-containing dehydrogenase
MMLARARTITGPNHILTGKDMAKYASDWTGGYLSTPLAVARPADTQQVAALVRLAHDTGTAVVPVGGNTGLSGATQNDGALMISLERLNTIRDLNPASRSVIAGAGVILADLQGAAEPAGLKFPLTFGARGSAMIGGTLATNAGGSNVLRYGNMRALCLGLEVVTPAGEIMDLMSNLHKDNSGYDLRDLFIGAEGTLGIITAAVLKLVPAPRAYATAMVALPDLADALALLNQLQEATGGAVEAFEFMPRAYMQRLNALRPDLKLPLGTGYDVNILVEVGATAPRDCTPLPDGSIPITSYLEDILGEMLEAGTVIDAAVARSGAQRAVMWEIREAAAEVAFSRTPLVNSDVAVPLDQVATFLDLAHARLATLDAAADTMTVSHLGDGNLHFTIYPGGENAALQSAMVEMVEDVVSELRGSFSAEHGIGRAKLSSMTRRKDPVALAMMRNIKAALDPRGIMNPGKTIPDQSGSN